KRVTREHAIGARLPGLLRSLPNATRDFIRNVLVVGSLTAHQQAEADHRIDSRLARECETAGGKRNFKRSRDTHHLDVLALRAGADQCVHGTRKQALGNEGIKAAHDNAETRAADMKFAFDRLKGEL